MPEKVDELWCQGQVKVTQEPEPGKQKGTKIDGEKLKMTAVAEGGYPPSRCWAQARRRTTSGGGDDGRRPSASSAPR